MEGKKIACRGNRKGEYAANNTKRLNMEERRRIQGGEKNLISQCLTLTAAKWTFETKDKGKALRSLHCIY